MTADLHRPSTRSTPPAQRAVIMRVTMIVTIAVAIGLSGAAFLALSDRDVSTSSPAMEPVAATALPTNSVELAPPGAAPPPDRVHSRSGAGKSAGSEATTCATCHADIVDHWRTSHHALANRWIDDVELAPGQVEYGGIRTRIDADRNLVQADPNGFDFTGRPVAVLGVDPLVQPILEFPSGHWQVFNPAFHPERGTWFNAFPDVRKAGEWGHWTGRAMNWNTQCAWCHMTDFEKNYDIVSDSYGSEWTEMGISCAQCHGDLAAHAADPRAAPAELLARPVAQENCLTCHSRREFLTAERFEAGDDLNDHFRIALFNQPGIYYPDGQVLSENFVGGSGDDTIFASDAANVLDGGDGNDTFVFETAASAQGDHINGFNAGDVLQFGTGADAVTISSRDHIMEAGFAFEYDDAQDVSTISGSLNEEGFQLTLAGRLDYDQIA